VVDVFAAEFLLPMEAVVAEWESDSSADVRMRLVRLAAAYKTSWSLALRQAEQAKLIDGRRRRLLASRSPTKAELSDAIGWAPQPDLDSIRVPPLYAHAVMEAWRAGAVTSSRAVEMMRGQLEDSDLPVEPDEDPR
jgi:Zn-dependent peptidase ImmA (M78 family)